MTEKEVLQEIFETKLPQLFDDKTRLLVIDAFSQFSQNPTSMSAGYGIEKNYLLIEGNLKKRNRIGKIEINNIFSFLKESFNKMKEANYEVYFWREAILDYIEEKFTESYFQWFISLFEELSEEQKQQFIFLLNILHHTASIADLHKWFTSFFSKDEKLSQSDTEDCLIRWGLGNILYYRSGRGYEVNQFVPFQLIDRLRKRFKNKITVEDKKIEEFFDGLLLDNIRMLEKCSNESIPVFENRMGRITQESHLIVESSKSFFGISPFAIDKIRELIRAKRIELTKEWKEKFSDILTTFIKETYPFTELKNIFDIEGAYCWEIRYVDSPEKSPIKITFLLTPYLFYLDQYSTILDEMKRATSSPLNLIFLIKETLPTVADALRYISSQRNLIFLFEEKTQSFYVIDRSEKLAENISIAIDNFMSTFLPFIEKDIRISKTVPEHLKDYMESLKYFSQFPRLVSIRNKMLTIQPKLRESIREKLYEKFGDNWKEKVEEKFSRLVKKCENVIQKRPDKEKAKDFLDGATLGELTNIANSYHDIFGLEENLVKGFLNILNQHRKVSEHPFTEPEEDLDEKTYKILNTTFNYVESVICSE